MVSVKTEIFKYVNITYVVDDSPIENSPGILEYLENLGDPAVEEEGELYVEVGKSFNNNHYEITTVIGPPTSFKECQIACDRSNKEYDGSSLKPYKASEYSMYRPNILLTDKIPPKKVVP